MKDIGKLILCLCFVIITFAQSQAGQYCGKDGDQEFFCDKGHCCGDFKCCTYYRYYEMWWFWLIWCIIIMLGCSCAYYRRSRTGTYSHLTSFFYPTPPLRTSTAVTTTATENEPTFKLPSYEEVIAMPQLGPPNDNEGAPPPYVCYTENPLNEETQLNCREQHSIDVVATEPAGTNVIQTERNPTLPVLDCEQ